MACVNSFPTLGSLTTTTTRSATDFVVMSSFIPLTGSGGKEIRSITVRNHTANSFAAEFRYCLIYVLSVGGTSTVYNTSYVSATLTIPVNSTGLFVYNFSPYLTIPNDGRVYYGALQQGAVLERGVYWLHINDGSLSGYDVNSVVLSSFLTAGDHVEFTNALTSSTRVLGLSEEVCDITSALTLSPDSLTQTPTLPSVTLTSNQSFTADSLVSVPTLPVVALTNNQTYAPGALTQTPTLPATTINREGEQSPEAIAAAMSIETATFGMTIPLTPESFSITPSLDTVSTNRVMELTPASLGVPTTIQTALNFSLANFNLSNRSTRTPDAGINMSWEESGVPKSYSWYNKTLYKFHLEFEHITEEQCLLLEDFCDVHRYDEIDYQWPFDNHTYRCVLVADIKETIIRSDTALGVRCNASLELLGYEVA